MSQSQYSLSWNSYKSNICTGFSALQQNGEFVDMTIAADGHLVKAHQVLVALASPYLKDLMSSAPCPHPVIFLNNISHKVLCYLLEYIYTGEVMVPCENIASFAEAAKSLHIKGLENIGLECTQTYDVENTSPSELTETTKVTRSKRKAANIDDFNVSLESLPITAKKVHVKPEILKDTRAANETADMDTSDFPDLDDTGTQDSDDGFKYEGTEKQLDKLKSSSSKLLFTVSIRGSLQIILNRYIYNLNSTSKTSVRKWRCVDYRNRKCTAFVVTKGNVVVNRANPHTHPFHDKKILAKIEKKSVFSALDEVEAYQDKEKQLDKDSILPDSFESFEEFKTEKMNK